MTRTRLAIVGCGRAAERLHLPAILESRCASLVAAVDVRAERARVIAAAAPGCSTFSLVEDMLAAGGVDGVIVATPVENHLAASEPILRATLPVLLEKPLATAASAPEAREFAERSARWGGWTMLAYNRRHWPAAVQLRALLRERSPGPDDRAELNLHTNRDQWNSLDDAADPLDDLGSHQLDLLRFLFDEPVVTVAAERTGLERIEMLVALRNGVHAICTAAFETGFLDRVSVRVGQDRFIIHAGSKYVAREGADGDLRTCASLGQRLVGALRGHRTTYRLQLEAFCAAIAAGRPAGPSVMDGLATVYATLAARTSMDAGATVINVEQV